MAKAELKTKLTGASVTDFLNSAIKDETTRKDCFAIVEMMKQATKAEPKMWGSAIIGFGDAYLKYESGRELDWFVMGFAPRKAALSLYLLCAAHETELLKKLGNHKMSKGCLYIKSLGDVDTKVLKELMKRTAAAMKNKTTGGKELFL
jgi:hypothetical protein